MSDVSTGNDSPVAVQEDSADTTVTIPTDPSNDITLTSSSPDSSTPVTVRVGLPFGDSAASAQVVDNGIVSYDNGNGSATVPVVKDDGSVQISTVLRDPSAPSRYSYPVQLPSGASLSPNDNGSVSVLDQDANLIAGFAPAWAKDANGIDVPTHYEIDGSDLVQVVDLSSADIAYPVVADPFLGKNTIDHTTWVTRSSKGPTLEVFPTTWGRIFDGPLVWGEQWGEVVAKTKTNKAAANTSYMKNQFECHLALGASLWKGSYNLDTFIHRSNLADYIEHRCN